ncbi:MAG: nitroreductase family deazaflavin-dependent oxidoreductase [Acidobacteria bacterium]|nr:MAG: nitroreductase family deazaflavin-dependent oxidoreductase [Acidobacteriota bacterium]
MENITVKWLSSFHTLLYHTTGGRVGHRLVNNDMLLLATTGRVTGKTHTVPLLYLTDGDRLVVIASYGGRPDHPQWYKNLLATPQASVQINTERRDVTAATMNETDRAVWWPKVVAAYSDYAEYQSKTDRQIPLVFLSWSELA